MFHVSARLRRHPGRARTPRERAASSHKDALSRQRATQELSHDGRERWTLGSSITLLPEKDPHPTIFK